MKNTSPKLNPKKRYLQIALNSTLKEAFRIIELLPISDRILIEVGTPLIKQYGQEAIRKIKTWYKEKLFAQETSPPSSFSFFDFISKIISQKSSSKSSHFETIPYIVADLKTIDRAEREVKIASFAGADAVVAMGSAPVETLNAFIESCQKFGVDAMIDMMNVDYPLSVLRKLKRLPQVVILHRGVDEERLNKEKTLPLYEIKRIKANYDILVSVAGGDTIREIQSAILNDADIVVVWKDFYKSSESTAKLAEEFLKKIKQ